MTAAIAGSMQAEMGLRLLLGARRGEAGVAQSVEFTLDPPQLATIKIGRASGCPFHEELPGACMFEADADLTVAELLGRAGRDRSGEPMLILDWPICVSARCRDCRYLWNPVVRVARFHHSGVCPRCHSRRLTACRTVHRLGKASEFADYRLRALGMPASNLYTIEFQRSGLQ
jgi:hypothetical protein